MRHEFPPVEQASNPVRKSLVTPVTIRHYCISGHHSALAGWDHSFQGSQLEEPVDDFSFPIAYRTFCTTVKASQQEGSFQFSLSLVSISPVSKGRGTFSSRVLHSSSGRQLRAKTGAYIVSGVSGFLLINNS